MTFIPTVWNIDYCYCFQNIYFIISAQFRLLNLLLLSVGHTMLHLLMGLCVSKWFSPKYSQQHYSDVILSAMASQTTGVLIVYSTVCSYVDQRKHQSSASLAFVRGIHRWPVNSPHKGPVMLKMLPIDDVIIDLLLRESNVVSTMKILEKIGFNKV